MKSLENKVALITGGSKGIGYGVAQELLKMGVHVAITSRTLKGAQKAALALEKSAPNQVKVIGLKADVCDYKQQELSFCRLQVQKAQLLLFHVF